MSWGVDIEVVHGDGYTTTIEVFSGHTYNLTPMWRKAGVFSESSAELDWAGAREVAPRALMGLADAWTNKAAYCELEPPNGWGGYDGFVEMLTRLARLCHEHPRGVLRWNG